MEKEPDDKAMKTGTSPEKGSFSVPVQAAYRINTRRRKKHSDTVVHPDLLAGVAWQQGSNTTMTIANGLVRATGTIGDSRVYKQVTGLVDGATYKINGTMYKRTATGPTGVQLRVSASADLPDGSIYQFQELGASHTFVDQLFTMAGTALFIGIVADINNTGENSEVDEGLTLHRV